MVGSKPKMMVAGYSSTLYCTLEAVFVCKLLILNGGEGGIRTHGTRKGSTVFETARFNHSRTSPYLQST